MQPRRLEDGHLQLWSSKWDWGSWRGGLLSIWGRARFRAMVVAPDHIRPAWLAGSPRVLGVWSESSSKESEVQPKHVLFRTRSIQKYRIHGRNVTWHWYACCGH